MAKLGTWGVVGALLSVSGACSDVRLELPEEEFIIPVEDDQLRITGNFCTAPSANVEFPVKIMFIVDGSGSQQFTDQNRQRVVAVEDTINSLAGTNDVEFKIVVFNASITSVPDSNPTTSVFTSDINVISTALSNLAEADTLTDYQGALAFGYAELQRDMQNVLGGAGGAAELQRTKYVVIFISDGLPDPDCKAGLGNDFDPFGNPNRLCEDQDFLNCLMQVQGTTCGGGVCDYNGTLCFEQPNPNALFAGAGDTELAAGVDYNQPYQILQRVDDIMRLQDRYEVGDLRLHSGLVLDPLVDPAIIAIFGDASMALPLMEQAADIGQGTFMEFYGGDSINFASLDFSSLRQNRVVRGFYADNRNSRVGAAGLEPDSDADGMPDPDEFRAGLDPRLADTDGDGFGDLLETRLTAYGFDPKDACEPPIVVPPAVYGTPCDPAAPFSCAVDWNTGAYADGDRDGLHDCEEGQLGTDPANPDTDQDGIPDRLDYVWGMDPLRWDIDRDDDQDGLPNGREIEWHLHPTVAQSQVQMRERFRYDRPEVGQTVDGRPCYDFAIRHVTLVPTANPYTCQNGIDDDGDGAADFPADGQCSNPTLDSEDGGATQGQRGVGWDRVFVYISENMADDLAGVPLYRVACVDGRYVPPGLKVPLADEVRLFEGDFRFLPHPSDAIFDFDGPACNVDSDCAQFGLPCSSNNRCELTSNYFDPTRHCLSACNDDSNCFGGTRCDSATNLCRP